MANLQRAEADLEQSRLGFERARQMHREKLISDSAFDQADAELKMKQAAVESQKRRIAQQVALLETNRDDLEKTTVVSPITARRYVRAASVESPIPARSWTWVPGSQHAAPE